MSDPDPYVLAARRLLRDPLAEQIVAMLLRAWDEEIERTRKKEKRCLE
jgi:hypothetical protein